jgi:hypothetical protein
VGTRLSNRWDDPVTLDRHAVADTELRVAQKQDHRFESYPIALSVDAFDWVLVARGENLLELIRLEGQGWGGRYFRKLDGEDRVVRDPFSDRQKWKNAAIRSGFFRVDSGPSAPRRAEPGEFVDLERGSVQRPTRARAYRASRRRPSPLPRSGRGRVAHPNRSDRASASPSLLGRVPYTQVGTGLRATAIRPSVDTSPKGSPERSEGQTKNGEAPGTVYFA